MSTSGFVGIGTPDQFHARYNHYDSYPTGLGLEVWTTVQRFLSDDGNLHGFARTLLGYTDWRQMEAGGICEYCGQRTSQPHSISGVLGIADQFSHAASLAAYRATLQQRGFSAPDARRRAQAEWPIVRNLRRTGYPDPEAQHHRHDTLADSDITPDTINWLFMEWGYLVDPDAHTLHVMVGCIETPLTYTVDIIRRDGTHELWDQRQRYTGAVVASYDLAGPEPAWGGVKSDGDALQKKLAATFASDPDHPLLIPLRSLPSRKVWGPRAADPKHFR